MMRRSAHVNWAVSEENPIEALRASPYPGLMIQTRPLRYFKTSPEIIRNHFNQERQLTSRDKFKFNRTAAIAEWRQFCAA